ncbi:hypothetical protein ACTFIU_008917 [Dictyostelium citrinum]
MFSRVKFLCILISIIIFIDFNFVKCSNNNKNNNNNNNNNDNNNNFINNNGYSNKKQLNFKRPIKQNNQGNGLSLPGNDRTYSFDSNYCLNQFILDNIEYDLTLLQNKIYKINFNKTTDIYVNLCLINKTTPCQTNESVCMVNSNTGLEMENLGNFNSLEYANNNALGVDFSFVGGRCLNFENDGSISDISGDSIYYKTNISLICGSNDNQTMISFLNACHLSIIIKTTDNCVVSSQSINSILKIFVILFAVIIAFAFIIGISVLCREKLKKICCCCFDQNRRSLNSLNHNNININDDEAPNNIQQPNENTFLLNNSDNNGVSLINNNNNINNNNINNNNISINNNNNNNINNNNNNNSGNKNIYEHNILQGETPESDCCTICFDSKINAVLLKCGHCAVCLQCAKKINSCPICRKKIDSVVQMYQV